MGQTPLQGFETSSVLGCQSGPEGDHCCRLADSRQEGFVNVGQNPTVNGRQLHYLVPLEVVRGFTSFDVNFYQGRVPAGTLHQYYEYCLSNRFMVVTSCFDAWKQADKTNKGGKIIPAIPTTNNEGVRVFFFDDHLYLHLGGSKDTTGICNLIDISTDEFVDFSENSNGFLYERCYNHTIVHYSSMYCNVLVQVNVLDASVNEDYFNDIVKKYSYPGEKILFFVDVHGTIMWSDTMSQDDKGAVLLRTMFRFTEVRPQKPCEFEWDSRNVKLDERLSMRQLVSDIYLKQSNEEDNFWQESTCTQFFKELSAKADMRFYGYRVFLSVEFFFCLFEEYLGLIQNHITDDAMPISWVKFYEQLQASDEHSIVLNTFGVGAMPVYTKLGLNVRDVPQLTINHCMWSEKDVSLWKAQIVRGLKL